MRGGIALGRLFGIDIHIDWSWFFIFLLVVWQLGAGLFPAWHPLWGPGLSWGVAICAAILFFASVLAHELAHSLVAISKGLPVRRITLFLFGGVSNIQREPPSAGTELQIAVVGPVISIVLGIICLILGGLGAARVQDAVVSPAIALSRLGPGFTLLLWLGQVNLLVGVFNLIPGFPLDGGRVLRAMLWSATGSLRRATRMATTTSHVVAWVFIVAGILMMFGASLPVFGSGIMGGIWLAFIGWFLNNAAEMSYRQVVIHDVLEGVPVSRLMRQDLPTVAPDLPVSRLVDSYMMRTDQRQFPVVRDGRLEGVVGVEDVHQIPRNQWDFTPVTAIMRPAAQIPSVSPDEDASAALEKLANDESGQAPVLDSGRYVGMLRSNEVLRWLQLHADTLSGGEPPPGGPVRSQAPPADTGSDEHRRAA